MHPWQADVAALGKHTPGPWPGSNASSQSLDKVAAGPYKKSS
jgi:hypothetical protein